MTITVLESFEPYTNLGGGQWQGDLLWGDLAFGASALVVSSSTLHVTQGTKSWKCLTSGADQEQGVFLAHIGLDLTGYVSISVDVYIAQLGGGDTVLAIDDQNGVFAQVLSAIETTTGAKTLTIDLTTITDPINNVAISLIGSSNLLGGSGTAPAEVYWDNLRADDGSGGGPIIPVFYMNRITQGMS